MRARTTRARQNRTLQCKQQTARVQVVPFETCNIPTNNPIVMNGLLNDVCWFFLSRGNGSTEVKNNNGEKKLLVLMPALHAKQGCQHHTPNKGFWRMPVEAIGWQTFLIMLSNRKAKWWTNTTPLTSQRNMLLSFSVPGRQTLGCNQGAFYLHCSLQQCKSRPISNDFNFVLIKSTFAQRLQTEWMLAKRGGR